MRKLDINDPYHLLFLEDTKEQIAQIEQEMLVLEAGDADSDTLNNIMRMAHSLKGSAATLEIGEMEKLAHHLEDLLMKVKKAESLFDPSVMEVMLESVDQFNGIYANLSSQSDCGIDINPVVDKIIALAGETTSREQSNKTVSNSTADALEQFCPENSSGATYQITIGFEDGVELKAVKAFIIISALQEVGTVLNVSPIGCEELMDDEFGDSMSMVVTGAPDESTLRTRLDAITDLKTINIVQADAPAERVAPAVISNDCLVKSVPDENRFVGHIDENATVRVNINKINKLINLVGELIIDKEALNKICKDLKQAYRKDASVNRLTDVYTHINYLGSELQEIVLSTRMLPLEHIFNKFPRMVRDLALKCDKNIRFVIEGKETGIDRGIIEELADPLTHLLRNAVDHGIDSEQARIIKGKSPTGTITLSASQGENHVIIVVEDDGNGIDVNRIKRKALDGGMVLAEQVEEMTDEEIMQFIFEPGFSTAKAVTNISGRGVGLDVVKSNIAKLNGIVEISSKLGQGTKFIMKLPLTLAIIKATLIQEGQCTFAIPVASIIEVIRLKSEIEFEAIHKTAFVEVFSWRGQVIPLIRLGEYFALDSNRAEGSLYVIVVGHGEKRTALIVDKVLGEQEIVIKSMADFVGVDKLFGELRGVSGVSILGDGSFAHIIDIAAISKIKVK